MKYLILIPLLIDCLCNVLVGGSFRQTLSATAWTVYRDRKFFGWLCPVINAIFFFQPDHCRLQYLREQTFGGALAAWRAQ